MVRAQSILMRVHPSDREEVVRQIKSALKELRPFDFDCRVERKDGSQATLHVRGEVLIDQSGKPVKVVGVAQDITDRKKAERESALKSLRLELLLRALMNSQEEERSHIARELHDELGQLVTGLRLAIESAQTSATDPIHPGLDRAWALADDLLALIRDMSHRLRPPMLKDLGILPALEWLFERQQHLSGLRIDFRHGGLEGRRFDPQLELGAYRIVQEALTNVSRHAGVSEVSVTVAASNGNLLLEVSDPGRGFEPKQLPSQAAGILGMRERASALGGSLMVESSPGQGVRVRATLPLGERERQWA